MSTQRVGPLLAASLIFAAADGARAQQTPTRLPAVVVNAVPDAPGARKIAGLVRDTIATPLESVEIAIPDLRQRAFSNQRGEFRFEGVAPGTYEARARKIGYHPQTQTIKVDTAGGVTVFALIPSGRVLPPVVSTAMRGGLSGTVGDTGYRAIPGATVRVIGHGDWTKTDSLGAFYMPLKPGSYVVSVTQPGFSFKLVSVVIPPDSGRAVTVFLPPQTHAVSHESANALLLFDERQKDRSRLSSSIVTHAEMEKLGLEWGWDAVMRGAGAVGRGPDETWVDPDCAVILNGGPETTPLKTLTVDEIETIEVYPVGGGLFKGGALTSGPRRAASKPATALSSTRLAAWRNGTLTCPVAYVWTR
jgi:hypothetical protein